MLDKSMDEVIDDTVAWLGHQTRVASKIQDSYQNMMDNMHLAAKQLPQEVEHELNRESLNNPYDPMVREGARTMSDLRQTVPQFIKHTKDQLMSIFNSVPP